MSADPSLRLTPNITLGEMCRTSRREWQASNLEFGARNVAKLTKAAALPQAARSHFGHPVRIHSGARVDGLNAAVGGSSRSQHKLCEAVDWSIPGVDLVEVWRWCALQGDIGFGQLILELDRHGDASWIHSSLGRPYRPASKSQQVMVSPISGGRRQYQIVNASTWGR